MAKNENIIKGPGSKRLRAANEGIDKENLVALNDAVKLIKERATAKFDETIELALNLGVDIRQSDQNVRGVVGLPNGTGKTVRVAVVAEGDYEAAAKKAGADLVGTDLIIDAVKKGDINFDRLITTPDMMPKLGAVAKVLGPKGLMPNPKLGTVTKDIEQAVADAKAGQVEFRAEKNGIVHAGVGKASFSEKQLIENIGALVAAIQKAKPSAVKGVYLKKAAISSTMGPGIRVDVTSLAA